jgi:hypothetical protein
VAPLVVKDKVVGNSGGEYGARGHIDAFDVHTGRPAWRRYAVPKPGEPGAETWGRATAWERGGGAAWITGSYDPELNLLYWSSGNPSPDFDGIVRPGDNLYTNAVLALRPGHRCDSLAPPVDAARRAGLRRRQREHAVRASTSAVYSRTSTRTATFLCSIGKAASWCAPCSSRRASRGATSMRSAGG